ncbi:MAG: hypothetical protein E7580_02025 [Ruminococcaceae bacterium]|nr:hypothetical protein [Oscillospiraceae bacterium]
MKKESGKNFKVLVLLLILIVPILIAIFVLRQNQSTDLRKGSVESVTLVYGNQNHTIEDKGELEFFISLAESGESIAETLKPLSEYRKCEAIFHKVNKDVKYQIYMSDSAEDCVYTDPDGKLFRIPEKEAKKLLAHSLLTDYAVSYSSFPTLEFSQGGKKYGAKKIQGEWSFSKTNGEKSKQKVSEKADRKVVLPQGEELNFEFSLKPDFCSITLQNEKGEILYSGDPEEMELVELETDTLLSLAVKCDWYEKSQNAYSGSLTYTFDVFYDVPTVCSIDRQTVSPGEKITITVEHSSTDRISVIPGFSAEKNEQSKEDGVWTVTVLVADDVSAGEYSIRLTGSDVEENFTVTVRGAKK